MIAMFLRGIEYIVVKISTYITPYLIESTLELLESTGVDLCTHVQYLCTNIVLCSSANCSNKSAVWSYLHGTVRYCALLCVIVRYCALL